MQVIPAIDLRGGRCVRLVQGDYNRETVFSDDPVAVALRWEQEGAERLQLIDLDGARTGAPTEAETIERIVRAVSIPVQVGGGMRLLQQAHRYLQAGADRVIFGTAAIKDRDLIAEALAMDRAAVIVALDAKDGRVQIEGWRDETDISAIDLAHELEAMGVVRVLATDVSRDGTLTEPNYGGLAQLCAATSMAVIAAGGVASLAQLARLAAIGAEAAILGRALYSGAVRLPEALAAVADGKDSTCR
jgi:phosphoribosylformimino-5-aminoimidazole carboxamide ribotide isomerase